MKNIAFFVTHKTLDHDHAEMSFWGMGNQLMCGGKKFDVLYLYNTHQDELSNDFLLELYHKYDLQRFFKEVKIFDYDTKTPKKLSADVTAICDYCYRHYQLTDRILILKSDCVPSCLYFHDILNLEQNEDLNVFFVAPFVCGKDNVTNDEIKEYCSRMSFTHSDEITFCVEDQVFGKSELHHSTRQVTDKNIRFTSCYVITDFSAHFFTLNLFDSFIIEPLTWGGVKFYNVTDKFVGTQRSFIVHKFHDIVSENRKTGREGPVVEWLKG